MFNKLKQIKDMRDQAKAMQDTLTQVIVTGESRGVKITMDGTQNVQSVEIADGLDKATIEQGVKAAFAEAVKKLQKELAGKMKDMGGLDFFKNLGM